MFWHSNIWITFLCFLFGMLLGALVLILCIKRANANLKDPWEEMDEIVEKFKKEQEEKSKQKEEDSTIR